MAVEEEHNCMGIGPVESVLPTTITISMVTPAMIQDAVAHKHGVRIGYEVAKKAKEKKKLPLGDDLLSKQLSLRNFLRRCDTYCRSGSDCDIGYGGL